MKVTYIGHSGFAVELEDKVLIFDYYQGEIPEADPSKKWFVFVSHGHEDHFNPEIFSLRDRCPQITYILSEDIGPQGQVGRPDVLWMRDGELRLLGDMLVRTLKSNDEGVAFFVETNGRTIYHAGDLNWWHWEGEPDEDNRFMMTSYKREIAKIKGEHIDVAFVVVDPGQEEQFWWGINWFMKKTDTDLVIPMHMWEDYETPERLKALDITKPYRDRIASVPGRGSVIVE